MLFPKQPDPLPPQDSSPFSQKPKGFTLWKVGGVVISLAGFGFIIPFLLPYESACGCADESRSNIGASLRGQQAYFLEKHQFSDSIDALGLGIPTTTQKYQYKVDKEPNAVIHYALPIPPEKAVWFERRQRPRANMVGAVFLIANQDNPQEMIPETIICQGQPGDYRLPLKPILVKNKPTCPANYTQL
ncbi:type IV pilin-like G/H family protein [Spirulina sp. CCNP1310]|uniref:type IV pilin-like G/H family protein n=1 Tax=Spirulina sp. CCNP1310 TaxID=3110249 RepID=UPI002B2212C8|nr:type IV pilin-like G/H family protein [Spirulina sp. CCNP1310]MEA5420319.1 type IV pilin-like G/H family protein [Spirulina sp. CCNP1310]